MDIKGFDKDGVWDVFIDSNIVIMCIDGDIIRVVCNSNRAAIILAAELIILYELEA